MLHNRSNEDFYLFALQVSPRLAALHAARGPPVRLKTPRRYDLKAVIPNLCPVTAAPDVVPDEGTAFAHPPEADTKARSPVGTPVGKGKDEGTAQTPNPKTPAGKLVLNKFLSP